MKYQLGDVQYKKSDIPTYWSYATQYGLGANFFSDAETSSTPNHISMLAAQTGGDFGTLFEHGCKAPLNQLTLNRDTDGDESYGAPCYNINSVPEELTNAGISWKFYGEADEWDPLPFIEPLSSTPAHPYSGPIVAPFDLGGISANSPGNTDGIGQLGQPLTIRVKYTPPTAPMRGAPRTCSGSIPA